MRIDAMNQVSQVYRTNGARKYNNVANAGMRDRVEISQLGKDIQVAKQAVAAAPDVRADKVAAMKEALANGTYSVSNDKLADKLMESFDI